MAVNRTSSNIHNCDYKSQSHSDRPKKNYTKSGNPIIIKPFTVPILILLLSN